MNNIEVLKDSENERPIPNIWRGTFSKIIHSFVKQDFGLSEKIKNVSPVSEETAIQIKEYIKDYGKTLIELPKETWDSSIYIWAENHWDVVIDLWTENEGRSDLVLSAKVTQENDTYLVEIYMVYVPVSYTHLTLPTIYSV